VVMVLLAIAAAKIFHLDPVIKIAIIALAISPVPPLLPKKSSKVGATDSYVVGLTASTALFSIVLIPAWLALLGNIFHFEADLALDKVVPIVLEKVLLPLLAGILIHHFAPRFAARAAKPVALFATVLLIVGVLPVLFVASRPMWAMIGNGVLTVMVCFAVVGIAVGHFLGGPDPNDRSVLALATSTRHPGITLAIASLNFPDYKKAVLIVVLIHLIVSGIVAIPYMKSRKKLHADALA
jgi:bile acid:Na+ symporter, BASS family